ncbi:hypothetical protein NL50_17295 [Clostridium acetobutylicum]|nr:hypothetical protein NL50_17295 [Clostridium acetobutylicum]
MHNALDIAKYIINKCIDFDRPISNLQLQKILYYVQGEFMKNNNGEALFRDDIEAWQYGPVVRDVYYEFNNYSSSNIDDRQEYNSEFTKNEIDIMDSVIKEKSKLSAWELVQNTHSERPWKDTYDKGKIITKEKMREQFCN